MRHYLFLTLLLSGCVSIPERDLGRIDEPPSLERSTLAAFEGGSFEEGEWPSPLWWELFNDPELSRLIELALLENPSLKSAEARVVGAKERAREQRAELFPMVDAHISDDWMHLSKNGLFRFEFPTYPAVVNLIDIALDFSYEFDFWGRNRDLFEAALGLAKSREAEYAEARLVLATALCRAYFDLQANQQKLALLKDLVQKKQTLNALTSERFQEGIDTDLEKLSSRQNIYELERAVLRLEAAIATSRHLVNLLVGRGPDDKEATPALFSETLPSISIPENISLDLLARRPDLMAQIWRVEAAAKEINAAKTNFYPNISLKAAIGLQSVFFSKLFRTESYAGNITPALHLPIFTAGRLRAQLYEKGALFNEAVFDYNNLVLRAAQEVADSLTILDKLDREVKIQHSNLETYRVAFSLRFQRFEQGIADYLTVLDAESALLDQQFIAVELSHQQRIAAVELIRALGGGYE